MVTYCHKCGKVIDDEVKDFLLCRYCNAFTPRNNDNTQKKMKGGKKMEEVKEIKEVVKPEDKIKSKSSQVKNLLQSNMPIDEIATKVGVTKKLVMDIRWKIKNNKYKK